MKKVLFVFLFTLSLNLFPQYDSAEAVVGDLKQIVSAQQEEIKNKEQIIKKLKLENLSLIEKSNQDKIQTIRYLAIFISLIFLALIVLETRKTKRF